MERSSFKVVHGVELEKRTCINRCESDPFWVKRGSPQRHCSDTCKTQKEDRKEDRKQKRGHYWKAARPGGFIGKG